MFEALLVKKVSREVLPSVIPVVKASCVEVEISAAFASPQIDNAATLEKAETATNFILFINFYRLNFDATFRPVPKA